MSSTHNKQQNLINNIQNLQNLEKKLYLNLEKLPIDNSNFEAQKRIINKINYVSKTRIFLFEQLQLIYSLIKDNVSNEKSELKYQMSLLKAMETHLNKSKKEINENKNMDVNNLRLIEINTYYTEQYRVYYKILRLVVLLCVPLLIFAILRQREILPPGVINILGIIVIVIGIFVIFPRILDLYQRNNMVFNEYDFPFNSENADNPSVTEHNRDELDLLEQKHSKDLKTYEGELLGECEGSGCCGEGSVYSNGLCIAVPVKNQEPFISGQSTQNPGAELMDKSTINKKIVADQNSDYYSFN